MRTVLSAFLSDGSDELRKEASSECMPLTLGLTPHTHGQGRRVLYFRAGKLKQEETVGAFANLFQGQNGCKIDLRLKTTGIGANVMSNTQLQQPYEIGMVGLGVSLPSGPSSTIPISLSPKARCQ